MNYERATVNTAVVSKLLVIAPYSADCFRHFGVQTGEYPRLSRPANQNLTGLLSRVLPAANTLLRTNKVQVSKVVITSAAFVASGSERVNYAFRAGIFGFEQI